MENYAKKRSIWKGVCRFSDSSQIDNYAAFYHLILFGSFEKECFTICYFNVTTFSNNFSFSFLGKKKSFRAKYNFFSPISEGSREPESCFLTNNGYHVQYLDS